MAEIPFYLQANTSGENSDLLFNIPIFSNPDLGNVKYTPESVGGIWKDMADAAGEMVGDTTDYVFDNAKNAWVSVKDAAKSSFDSVTSTIKEVGGGYFDWVKNQIIWILVVGLVVIWIVAKSGILSQASDVFRASTGG